MCMHCQEYLNILYLMKTTRDMHYNTIQIRLFIRAKVKKFAKQQNRSLRFVKGQAGMLSELQ